MLVPHKEQRRVIATLETYGWRIERRSRHVLAFGPDGKSRPIILGGSADGKKGGRTMLNMISNIERIDPRLKGKIFPG